MTCKCCIKAVIFLVMLAALMVLSGAGASAQEKVAEGEYKLQELSGSGPLAATTATRWVLYGKTSGGYHLRSEIQNLPGETRVVQTEELNDHLAPTAIGYELYLKNQKKPGVTVNCQFERDLIRCSGTVGENQVASSAPYKHKGPFWLWVRDLSAFDLPWLLDGTVNMSNLQAGDAIVQAITVSGGAASTLADAVTLAKLEEVKAPGSTISVPGARDVRWDFDSDEQDTLQFIGSQPVKIGEAEVSAKHYTFQSGEQTQNLWLAPSGVLVKLAGGEDNSEIVLANYKQYKKLIPELRVEDRAGAAQKK